VTTEIYQARFRGFQQALTPCCRIRMAFGFASWRSPDYQVGWIADAVAPTPCSPTIGPGVSCSTVHRLVYIPPMLDFVCLGCPWYQLMPDRRTWLHLLAVVLVVSGTCKPLKEPDIHLATFWMLNTLGYGSPSTGTGSIGHLARATSAQFVDTLPI